MCTGGPRASLYDMAPRGGGGGPAGSLGFARGWAGSWRAELERGVTARCSEHPSCDKHGDGEKMNDGLSTTLPSAYAF